MPSSPELELAFITLHGRLCPRKRESRLVGRHRVSIRRCLRNEFALLRFNQCGSFGNGTSIYQYSDTDYLAWLPSHKVHNNSRTMLRQVCAALKRSFPRTKITTTSPAIRVPFGSLPSQTTEVVPARHCQRLKTGQDIYEIANGQGGWMRTSPQIHNAYVEACDRILHKRLKPLICFLKAWKYYNHVPISSFYLELCAASYMKGKTKVVFDRDLAGFFAHLHKNLRPLRDPTGISGLIEPFPPTSSAKKRAVTSKVASAATRSANALDAAKRGKAAESFAWWDKVFAGKFPAYSGAANAARKLRR
jgi:hypothetical protein